jgi:hypothetical protein
MLDNLLMRFRLFKLSQCRTRELRDEFAAAKLDFSKLSYEVHAGLVADSMVNDAATAFRKFQSWMASEITWQQLVSDARVAGARV